MDRYPFVRALALLTVALTSQLAFSQAIQTVAGGGPVSSGFYTAPEPGALVTDRDGVRSWQIGAATGSADLSRVGPLLAGDGSPATAVALYAPSGVAFYSDGFFIVETASHTVRKVSLSTGLITTVAGDGTAGFSGDNGPATQARLNAPTAVAFDLLGNLYIADTGNRRVRRVSAGSNVITTFAGNGTAGTGGENGPATQAQLTSPRGVAVDGNGDLFIADAGNHIVRIVRAQNQILDTLAGTGVRGFAGDGGHAGSARLDTPVAVAVQEGGNVFVTDQGNVRVRMIAADTKTITTVAGDGLTGFSGDGGPATEASLHTPAGVALDGSVLLIADTGNHRIRRVTNGVITTALGNGVAAFAGDNGPASAASVNAPLGVATSPIGSHLYVSDTGNARVRAVYRCNAVSGPVLGLPLDGAQGVPTATMLDWGGVNGTVAGYDIYLYTLGAPARLLAQGYTGTTFPVANLLPNTQYSWRVVAKGDSYCSPRSLATSSIQTFRTGALCGPPAGFAEVSPAEGATTAADTTLSWQASAGAASYDVYLGATDPPALRATGVTATSLAVAGLAPGTLYRWRVVAHASCDASRTTSTSARTFRVGGACATPGAFTVSQEPSDDSTSATLRWTASSGAAAYDIYFGEEDDPPLFLRDVNALTATLVGLTPGGTYRGRVVAKSACDPSQRTSSSVGPFTLTSGCPVPAAPAFLSGPTGELQPGQTYALTFTQAARLGAGGSYVVERSRDAAFASLFDSQTSAFTSVSFVAPSGAGALYHRVRAVPACDTTKAGAFSASLTATVGVPRGNIVVTTPAEAVTVPLNGKLEDRTAFFILQNIGGGAITIRLSTLTAGDIAPFFSIVERQGGNPAALTFTPGQSRTVDIRFAGPLTSAPAAFSGLVTASGANGEPLPGSPFVFVSLTIANTAAASDREPLAAEEAPIFLVNGEQTELVSFPPLAGDDNGRPPISVDVKNVGTAPLQLGAEVGPEAWLVPEPGWNSTPITPGASRTVRLTTQRSLAPNGSAFPRHTFLLLRTPTGKTARLLVQDPEASLLGTGRTSLPDRSARSYIVPSVANVGAAVGGRFISRLTLSNSGSEAVQAELVFTPSGADGFDAVLVKRATVIVPANDVVALNDPLVKSLGLEPGAFGHLEVRAAPSRIGTLTVLSVVDAPQPTGGSFGFQLPTVQRGEGARAGVDHLIPGVNQGAEYRTNLILAETTGIDRASVRVVLYGKDGTRMGDTLVEVPRYGHRQVNRVVETLGGTVPLSAGRLELTVEQGGGSVAGVVTVIDNKSNDSVTYVSRPMLPEPVAGRAPQANPNLSVVVPAVVNGFPTFRGRDDLPYKFRSLMGFASSTLTPASFSVRYVDRVSGETKTKTVTVQPRQTVEYENVLEQLFGVGGGAKSEGPVFIDSSFNGTLYAKVYSDFEGGTLGDGFPVVVLPSELLTSSNIGKPIALDGLEQSVDITRGTRSNLIMNEVKGEPAKVTVRLYEAGNRTVPVAEREFELKAFEKVQLSTLFTGLGLEADGKRKDRANVLVVLTPSGGTGVVSAVVTTIDNKTGDTKNSTLAPTGGVVTTGTSSIGF